MATNAAALTADQREVLQAVYDELRTHGMWPTFGVLDRRFARSRPPMDLAQLLADIPESFALPLWSGGVPPQPEAAMKLTIEGVGLCKGTDEDVSLFLRALRWIATRELAFEPETSDDQVNSCVVTGRQLMRAFRLPTADCRLPTADCRLPTADRRASGRRTSRTLPAH